MVHIPDIMNETSASQARSLSYYWPADAAGEKDLAENNLAVHMAHAFFLRGYAVFAEVDHPDRTIQGVDLLAVASDQSHYVAAELKRHISAGMSDSSDDVQRLISFRLNRRLLRNREPGNSILPPDTCRSAFGVVAGLKWYGGSRFPNLDNDPVAERLRRHGGTVDTIQTHVSASTSGAYWLQYGFFRLETD